MSNNSFYKFILPVALVSLSLPSCSDSEEYTVSGDGSLSPLSISVNLSDGSAKTRALDKEFESADKLLAYIEHVDAYSQTVNVDMSPSLVTLDVNADPVHKDITNGKETSSLTVSSIKQGSSELLPTGQTVLYWDDFSSSSNDINTTGHGLRVKYGYCLNGRVLDPAPTLGGDGIMTWSVIQDQTTEKKADFKKSDLLWSTTQESVAYSHSTDRAGLKIPYTHAMSKVTLVLIANEGFATTAFTNTEATLLNMNITGTMRATDATITTASAGTGDDAGKVFMYKNTPATTIIEEKTLPICTFEALVMPTKALTNGLVIASLTDVEGNNYNITITDEILKGFNKNVDPENPNDNTADVTMKSGVNYKLTITLDKQPQTIVAQITDWNNVEATTTGEIKFVNDITSHNKDNQIDVNGASIALWRKATVTEFTGARTTTATFDNDNDGDETEDTWVCNPTLYWPDGITPYHFRALAKYDGSTSTKYEAFSGEGEEDDDFKVKQGCDIVWATTAAHTGTYKDADGTTKTKEYGEGAAIDPRTGTVPMAFEHAMSKITVKLETTSGADAVALAGATISIANIYDGGTIALEDGSIGSLTASTTIPMSELYAANDESDGATPKLSEYVVVPQSLIKMADGTTSRDGAVAFYNKSELTTMTVDGVTTTYDTSTLTRETVTAAEAITYNSNLTGAISTDTKYTAEEAKEHNAALDGAVKAGDTKYYTLAEYNDLTNATISEAQYNALPIEEKIKPESLYSSKDGYNTAHSSTLDETAFAALSKVDKLMSEAIYASAEEYNTAHSTTLSADEFAALATEKKIKPDALYTYPDYKVISPAIKPYASMTPQEFDALDASLKQNGTYDDETAAAYNAKLTGAVSTETPKGYTQDEVDAYNAKLPGAKKAGDFKGFTVNGSSKEAKAGEMKTPVADNPKIMMLITLADGTTYSVDLASCTPHVDESDSDSDIAWERGKHYTYTIKLTKSDITFRAMVKEWVEKTGSGNATLDWD